MLKSDALTHSRWYTTGDTYPSINIQSIIEIEKELEPYDLISLVFLLYDVPETALQRLIIFQRVYKDIGGSNSNLLQEWARHAQNRDMWKHQFLEALITCQIYNVVRKLGFNVAAVKKQYQENGEHFINPMKKLLYKLCENIDSEKLHKLKKTLSTYSIDTTMFESCELIFLDLMCRKFIEVQQYQYAQKITGNEYNIENLAKIIENFSGLEDFAKQLRDLEAMTKTEGRDIHSHPDVPPSAVNKDELTVKEDKVEDKFTHKMFDDTFDLINEFMGKLTMDGLATDKLNNDTYCIKNPSKVGVCYILNQEDFHPSKSSIESKGNFKPLDKRKGSTKDKLALEETMSKLNFEVITRDNLDRQTMLEDIKNVIKYRVQKYHSMFMLCILSHGIKGHVYAADSVKVKVEEIESLLDCDEVNHLRGMPKVIVLQACQVSNEDQYQDVDLAADGPKYYIKKSDVLIYWATAPDYEAYRIEAYGSLFIQILCSVIQKYADKDHLCDLFLKVNYIVHKACTKLCCDQLPKIESTLKKKLYLKRLA
ncbi:caspase-8 [Galleria mellonella]|uniref:Caspase-8 n=1 Tax=Galleria mellonella TaxID=7137 RepID=A0A6J1WR13_GALME|nr:caspase-8 [Galleria mellonella]